MPKQKFNYIPRNGILMPYLPIKLVNKSFSTEKMALVDSGSVINVLPYQLGIDLGFVWDDKKANIQLGGNLAPYPAIGVILTGIVGILDPVPLAFAWANGNTPLILGQVNFFQSFHICFFLDKQYFEISTKS